MIAEGILAGLIAVLSPIVGAVGSAMSAAMTLFQLILDLIRFAYTVLKDAYTELMRFRNEQPLTYLIMATILLAGFMWFDGEWSVTDGAFNPQALNLNPSATLLTLKMGSPPSCEPHWGEVGSGWSGSTGWEGVGSTGGGDGFGGGGGGFG